MLKARTLGHFEIVDLQAMRRCCGLGFVLVVGVVGLGGCSTSAERHQAQTDEESADSTEPSEVLVTLDSGETRWVRREGPLRHRIYPEQLAEVTELFAANEAQLPNIQIMKFNVDANGYEVVFRPISHGLPEYAHIAKFNFDRERKGRAFFHRREIALRHSSISLEKAAKVALEYLRNQGGWKVAANTE